MTPGFKQESRETVRKFPKVQAGEWIQPRISGYHMQCCNCNYVHVLQFRVIKYAKGRRTKIQLRATRAYFTRKRKKK